MEKLKFICIVLISVYGLCFGCEENGFDQCYSNGDCCSEYCEKIPEKDYGICQAACGQPITIQSPGRPAKQTFPWHAAIYEELTGLYVQICGGTLISRTTLVSAAQCFVMEDRKLLRLHVKNTDKLLVRMGKYYQFANTSSDTSNQMLAVKSIKIHPSYTGSLRDYHSHDIALVVLKQEVNYSVSVRPICADLTEIIKKIKPSVNKVIGKTVSSEVINFQPIDGAQKIIEMPMVYRHKCLTTINSTKILEIKNDRFCAGNKSSDVSICKNDRGGGLVWEDPETKLHHLIGVLSIYPEGCKRGSYVLFTAINHHQRFLNEYKDGFKKQELRQPNYCKPLTSEDDPYSARKLHVKCIISDDGIEGECNKPLPPNTKAFFDCQPQYLKLTEPDYKFIYCRNGTWNLPLVDDFCTPTVGGGLSSLKSKPYQRETEYGEFPWHAEIYEYNEMSESYDQICGGTLISENVVITAAHCVATEKTTENPFKYKGLQIKDFSTLRVALGKYYASLDANEEDDNSSQIIDVKNIEIPSQYTGFQNGYYSDIAFITLNAEVNYTKAVRPICLEVDEDDDNSEENQMTSKTKGKIVGWSIGSQPKFQEKLKVMEVPVVSNLLCQNSKNITNGNMIQLIQQTILTDVVCAGDPNLNVNICEKDAGTGLIVEDEISKRHYLRGVFYFAQNGCNEYALITKLSTHTEFLSKYAKDCKGVCEEICGKSGSNIDSISTEYGLFYQLVILQKLVTMRKTDDISVSDYILKIQTLNDQLEKFDQAFDDKKLAVIILMGLPLEKYGSFVRSLEAEKSRLTVKLVGGRLLVEEKRAQLQKEQEIVGSPDKDSDKAPADDDSNEDPKIPIWWV